MALGLLIAIAGTGSGIFLDKFFFLSLEIWGDHQLVFELMNSKLMALCFAQSHCRYWQWFFS
jgi:hypothetical protein